MFSISAAEGRSPSAKWRRGWLASSGKPGIEPEIAGKYRVGDVRHCFPDISLARQKLGYEPSVALEDGLLDLAAWLDGQVAHDRFGEARAELTARGLVV